MKLKRVHQFWSSYKWIYEWYVKIWNEIRYCPGSALFRKREQREQREPKRPRTLCQWRKLRESIFTPLPSIQSHGYNKYCWGLLKDGIGSWPPASLLHEGARWTQWAKAIFKLLSNLVGRSGQKLSLTCYRRWVSTTSSFCTSRGGLWQSASQNLKGWGTI